MLYLNGLSDKAPWYSDQGAFGELDNKLFLSTASIWELVVKSARGKLHLPIDPRTYVSSRMSRLRLEPLAITPEHALAVAALPEVHRDPFDRMLVAQAVTGGMTLVNADPWIARYNVLVHDPRT